jgi:hypothetical protein
MYLFHFRNWQNVTDFAVDPGTVPGSVRGEIDFWFALTLIQKALIWRNWRNGAIILPLVVGQEPGQPKISRLNARWGCI